MKKLLFSLLVVVLIAALSEAALYACGAKFLVSGNVNGPGMRAIRANTTPTSLLVYWQQDDDTAEEDRWSPSAEELLERLGHRVAVTLDADSFLAGARDGDFELLMVWPIDEARRLKNDIARVAPRSMVIPVLWNATQLEKAAASQEFETILPMPLRAEVFLDVIDKAGRTR